MKPVQIIVGAVGGPVAGTSVWNAPSLAGVDGYLQRAGFGTMPYNTYSVLPGGGIQLLDGTLFGLNETYFFVPTGIIYVAASSNYTNGYNYAAVMNALFGRLAWRGTTVDKYSGLLDNTNSVSRSQRYYDDGSFHSLCTIPNLKSVQDDPQITNAEFNTWLESFQRGCILRMLNGVLPGREYMEQVYLFDRVGYNDTEVANTGQFVGYEINLANQNDIAVQIEGATLQFNGDVTFNLYLFKDGKKTPVWVNEVSAVAFEQTQVTFSELVLTYINAATRGSRFYLGYFQSDLGNVKAIQEQTQCKNKTHCFSAVPVQMVKNAGSYTFNADQRSYPMQPQGLNLEISSFKDWTQYAVKKAPLFDELNGLTMAYQVLELIQFSTRSNADERLLKTDIDKALLSLTRDGAAPISESPEIAGLKQRLDREAARVKKQFLPRPKAQTASLYEC